MTSYLDVGQVPVNCITIETKVDIPSSLRSRIGNQFIISIYLIIGYTIIYTVGRSLIRVVVLPSKLFTKDPYRESIVCVYLAFRHARSSTIAQVPTRKTNRKPRKNAVLRTRPAVFSLSLRFVFNCQEQQVHREDVRPDAAVLFQILVKLFSTSRRRFHVVNAGIALIPREWVGGDVLALR